EIYTLSLHDALPISPRLDVVVRVGEAEVVPARAGPLRHRVRLAREPSAVSLEEAPVDGARQRTRRIVARSKVLEIGEHEGQLFDRDGLGLVVVNRERCPPCPRVALARDGEIDGDRLAPVPLPREHPVAETIGDLRLAF